MSLLLLGFIFLGFLLVNGMKFSLADMYKLNNDLLTLFGRIGFDGGNLLGGLTNCRFLCFGLSTLNSGSSFGNDLSHVFFGLGPSFLLGFGDSLFHSLFNEVLGSLLDFLDGLGSVFLDYFGLGKGCFGLSLFLLNRFLGSGVGFGKLLFVLSLECFDAGSLGFVGRVDSKLGCLFLFLLSLDKLSDNLNELMDLSLSLMSNLFNTGMLTLHGGYHRLQFLLHELSFDVANLLFLFVNMEGFPHLGVLSVDDS